MALLYTRNDGKTVLIPDIPYPAGTKVDDLIPYNEKGREYNPFVEGSESYNVFQKMLEERWRAKPIIICLCGSTRFGDAFRAANLRETLAGKIVLTVGCDFKSDDALGLDAAIKARLDELHLRKIDLADEVLILNVGGYIGESTKREMEYARQHWKRIRFLEPTTGGSHD